MSAHYKTYCFALQKRRFYTVKDGSFASQNLRFRKRQIEIIIFSIELSLQN